MANVVAMRRNDAAEIGDLYEASNKSLVEAVLSRIECGRRLERKKKELDHGEWLPWLGANEGTLGFGERTARKLMKAADTNRNLGSDLAHEDALKLSRAMWDKPPTQTKKRVPLDNETKERLATEWHYRDTGESPEDDDEPGDDAQTIWRRGLMSRALGAAANAQFEDWSGFETDDELVSAVKQAAAAWNDLAAYMEELQNGN